MRYSTTSLSAIILCVCMMLFHHANGTDMWNTPSSFTNNNPNQIQMTGQQWNQQPNTNMQFGSNNRNNVATPMHLNNNQGQPQSSERMIIQATVDPKNGDVYVEFSGKYKFRSITWINNSDYTHYKMKPTWNKQKLLVTCYKENNRYEKVKAFYDHIEGLTDHVSKKELDSILLRRMDNAQSANKEIGCIVFEHPQGYINLRSFLKRAHSFALVKHIPNMVARVMEAISYLNGVGVASNSIGRDHIMISTDKKDNIHGIKLIDFDRTVIFKEYAESMANGQNYPGQTVSGLISKAYLEDIEQTAAFINNLFNAYDNILTLNFRINHPALANQVKLYYAQRQSLWKLKDEMIKAEMPYMLFNVLLDHDNDYNTLATPAIRNV